jgi:RHS repeat-associated protein
VLVQETIWMGDIPIATLHPSGSTYAIFYVHTDHLNTPRRVSQPSDNQLRWRWDPNPFGDTAPNNNPASLGAFTYHLRYPGQYFDIETNLSYNYFRDYDSAIGRYVQSDPIGLGGGVNTFGYALSRPMLLIDPRGLSPHDTVRVLLESLFPQPWTRERCAQIQQKIDNLNKDIERRYALIRSNPEQLPQFGPGPNSTSVQGHHREINRLDQNRRKLEKQYDAHCNDNCPPGSPALDPSTSDLTTESVGAIGFAILVAGSLVFLWAKTWLRANSICPVKKRKAQLSIIDATGDVVHTAYVDDPSKGLRRADLQGLVAPLGQLQGLDLTAANLYWASLGDADLSFANLSRADLRGATLDRAICRGTNFTGANLGRDNLGGSTSLKGADLETAILHECTMLGAVYDDATRFPPKFDPTAAGMIHVGDLPLGHPGRI